MDKDNKKDSGVIGAGMAEAYEFAVGQEMLDRAGRNQCGKGVVHEILCRDQLNLKPENILTGTHAELASSTTAVRDDIVVTRGGKVVGRMQLKDTPASVDKTLQQVSRGKYAGTKLMGTKETAAAYEAKAAGRGIPQKMTSTGVSSKDTARIADKALGNPVALENILAGAPTAGFLGGSISGTLTAAELLLDGGHSAEEILEETAKSAVTGSASSAAGFVGAELAVSAAASSTIGSACGLIPGAAGIVAGAAAAKAVGTIAKSTVEGISDAIYCGSPEFVLDGLKEGLWDVADSIGEAIGSIGDGISDFLDNLFW